ncbi:hypothetical protein STANM309S_04295 [Streptomyces tanashiensis]
MPRRERCSLAWPFFAVTTIVLPPASRTASIASRAPGIGTVGSIAYVG